MRERLKATNPANNRLLDANEIGLYMGLGKSTARKICREIGAERRFGKRVLFDRKIIDKHLDSLAESEV